MLFRVPFSRAFAEYLLEVVPFSVIVFSGVLECVFFVVPFLSAQAEFSLAVFLHVVLVDF